MVRIVALLTTWLALLSIQSNPAKAVDPRDTIVIVAWAAPAVPDQYGPNYLTDSTNFTFVGFGLPNDHWFVRLYNEHEETRRYLSYDSLKAVGVDAIMNSYPGNKLSPGPELLYRAARDAGLGYLPMPRTINRQEDLEAYGARYHADSVAVRTLMEAPLWNDDAENNPIIGWYTWDDHMNVLDTTDCIIANDRIVRDIIRDPSSSAKDSAFTFVGSPYSPGKTAELIRMLSATYEPDRPRPVFGIQLFRFRRRVSGQNWPISALNRHCLGYWKAVHDPANRVSGESWREYPYWHFVHMTAENGLIPVFRDPPDTESLRIDVFSKLAWGAKGIGYVTYMHGMPNRRMIDRLAWGDVTDSVAYWPGVFTGTESAGYWYASGFNHVYYAMKTVNAEIHLIAAKLGPAICHVPVVAPQDPNVGYAEASSFVKSVEIVSYSEFDDRVLVTPFSSPDSAITDERYLMLVNQSEADEWSGLAGGPISVTVELDSAILGGHGTYRFYDMLHDTAWTVDATPSQRFALDSLRLERGGVRFISVVKTPEP